MTITQSLSLCLVLLARPGNGLAHELGPEFGAFSPLAGVGKVYVGHVRERGSDDACQIEEGNDVSRDCKRGMREKCANVERLTYRHDNVDDGGFMVPGCGGEDPSRRYATAVHQHVCYHGNTFDLVFA